MLKGLGALTEIDDLIESRNRHLQALAQRLNHLCQFRQN
jgi:hypothetical protein